MIRDVCPGAVLADIAYYADGLIFNIADKNAKFVVPPKANRKSQRELDKHQYRNRNVSEWFFAGIKQFRRIATPYDKLTSRSKSFFCTISYY